MLSQFSPPGPRHPFQSSYPYSTRDRISSLALQLRCTNITRMPARSINSSQLVPLPQLHHLQCYLTLEVRCPPVQPFAIPTVCAIHLHPARPASNVASLGQLHMMAKFSSAPGPRHPFQSGSYLRHGFRHSHCSFAIQISQSHAPHDSSTHNDTCASTASLAMVLLTLEVRCPLPSHSLFPPLAPCSRWLFCLQMSLRYVCRTYNGPVLVSASPTPSIPIKFILGTWFPSLTLQLRHTNISL